MLFEEEDAALLKKWIVKRLEDISDADSDVLADYVLALLRHDNGESEVKRLCVEQLDDFLREHTGQFVEDVFGALSSKSFLSVNSTLAGMHVLATKPDSPPPPARKSPSPVPRRGQKRGYVDLDAPSEENGYGYKYGEPNGGRNISGEGRGSKAPRRGDGRWGRGHDSGRGTFPQPLPLTTPPTSMPMPSPMPSVPFPMPPVPWMPPDPHDPMTAFLAAQAAAWTNALPPGAKPDDRGKRVPKKVGKRCRDYDEKGFCMKGDMCPYAHGANHIVVPSQESSKQDEYDPNNSMIVPSPKSEQQQQQQQQPVRGGRGGGRGGRGGRGSRSNFSATGPSNDRTNTRLVVESIPADKLSEAPVRGYFEKFGKLLHVEIVENKKLAVLTFDRWETAKAAYESPAPIFDNRFVKVFWLKTENDPTRAPAAAAPSTSASTPNGNGRRFSAASASQPPTPVTPKPEEPPLDIEEIKRKQEELQKIHEQKMAKKKANEEATKNLQKRAEELLKLQQEEKKKLLEKLAQKKKKEAATLTSSSAIASTEEEKKEATTAALKAQLEALEAEAEALGIDAAKQDEQASDYDAFRGRGRGFGYRGGYRTRGRGFPQRGAPYGGRGAYPSPVRGPPTMKLDNRTKRVVVTSTELATGEKEEEFRHYLINNGIELEAVQPHPEKSDARIVTFRDRRNAEKFIFAGTSIPDVGAVQLAWYNQSPAMASANAATTTKAPDTEKREYGGMEDVVVEKDKGSGVLSQHHPGLHTADGEEEYDLAEIDERWDQ